MEPSTKPPKRRLPFPPGDDRVMGYYLLVILFLGLLIAYLIGAL